MIESETARRPLCQPISTICMEIYRIVSVKIYFSMFYAVNQIWNYIPYKYAMTKNFPTVFCFSQNRSDRSPIPIIAPRTAQTRFYQAAGFNLQDYRPGLSLCSTKGSGVTTSRGVPRRTLGLTTSRRCSRPLSFSSSAASSFPSEPSTRRDVNHGSDVHPSQRRETSASAGNPDGSRPPRGHAV